MDTVCRMALVEKRCRYVILPEHPDRTQPKSRCVRPRSSAKPLGRDEFIHVDGNTRVSL